MNEAKGKEAPIRQKVVVDCPIEDAFRLFTEGFSEWWPLASHSVAGDDAEECAFQPWVGGRIFERTRAGEAHDWGEVTDWDPPHRIEFTWHPGACADGGQTVTIDFLVVADGTQVTLTHSGWEVAAAHACASPAFRAASWEGILRQGFAEFVRDRMLVFA